VARKSAPWNVLPHGPLERLCEDLWRVRGTIRGFSIGRNMIVARTPEGRLWIHNGVAVSDDVREEIEALGKPTWLVVPSRYHRLDAPAYLARYPGLQVTCPRGARADVEKRVPVDITYESFPMVDHIRVEPLDGVAEREGVWRLEREDGFTLVFNDVLFNYPHNWSLTGILLRVLGSSGNPKVSPTAKRTLVTNKGKLRAHLLRLADTPNLKRLVPGHELLIEDNAAEVLRDVAANL
jgi:hypothetical protein